MPIVSEEHKNQRKKQILDSALACFSQKGYDVATIDDIVKHSGISKGSIYNYFKSKEEIYIDLLEVSTKNIYDELTVQINKLHTAIDQMKFLFDYLIDQDPSTELQKDYSLVKFEFQLSSSRNEELKEVLENSLKDTKMKIIEGILSKGVISGEFRKELNIEVYAEMFWSFVDGATLQNLLFPNYPYHELLKEQKSIFLKKVIKP
ncbi:TetR/AcrR family transcriptional regulator [Cytobacillus sp. FJAT-54145]|uniref:TetR/AcrR family transcriptional regulator n=1 Tax=Cytobacillus spartinae TaxID=3299023 RepID=A0ABW6KFJ5_9BACI